MPKKPYKITQSEPLSVCEPAVAYSTIAVETPLSTAEWNPNVPFHGTQEEWWEHFHRIEEGEFYPVAEVHKRVLQWLNRQNM